MRVVINTNCLIASIPPEGGYYWLYEAFEAEQFEWLISNEIITEYLEMLELPQKLMVKNEAKYIL